MRIEIFGKQTCGRCISTKNKINHLIKKYGYRNLEVKYYDLDTVDGMAEGAFNDVANIPTTIIRKGDTPVKRWDGEVPTTEELRDCLQQYSKN